MVLVFDREGIGLSQSIQSDDTGEQASLVLNTNALNWCRDPANEYLAVENRILKAQIRARRGDGRFGRRHLAQTNSQFS